MSARRAGAEPVEAAPRPPRERTSDDRASPKAERAGPSAGDGTALPSARGAALGFLAMLPLFAAYEVGLRSTGGSTRNLAEVLLSLPLAVFGPNADVARIVVLALAALAAAWVAFHAELGLVPRIARIAFEGFLAAAVLGPLLLVLLSLGGGLDALRNVHELAPSGAPVAEGPSLARAALLAGGAAYEELLFRMGLFGLCFLAARAVLEHWLASETAARWCAEVVAAVLAAVVFAAAHLAVFTQVFGPGGEPWHPGVFPWRVLAGILLTALFRWRGPGVAAWTHALFNLALAIGAGPQVFL